MSEKFERHRQPWRQDDDPSWCKSCTSSPGRERSSQSGGLADRERMSLRAIAKALTRSEESVKDRARADKLKIARLR